MRGRGNRTVVNDSAPASKPLHEIRSVHYENMEKESAATKTKVMDQSNHILEQSDQPIAVDLNAQSSVISNIEFGGQRNSNTVMAGDLRE